MSITKKYDESKSIKLLLCLILTLAMMFTFFMSIMTVHAEDDTGYKPYTYTRTPTRANSLKSITYYVQKDGTIKAVLKFDESVYDDYDKHQNTYNVYGAQIKNTVSNTNLYYQSPIDFPESITVGTDTNKINPGDSISVVFYPGTDYYADEPVTGTDTKITLDVPTLDDFEEVTTAEPALPELEAKTYDVNTKSSLVLDFSVKEASYVVFDTISVYNANQYAKCYVYKSGSTEAIYSDTVGSGNKKYTDVLQPGKYTLCINNDSSSYNVTVNLRAEKLNKNKTVATAINIPIKLGTSTTAATAPIKLTGDKEGGYLFYKFTVTDKAYYKIVFKDTSTGTKDARLYTSQNALAGNTADNYAYCCWYTGHAEDAGEVVLTPGTYYIKAGATPGKTLDGTLYCRDFNDIKSIKGTTIKTILGKKTLLSVSVSPVEYPLGAVLKNGTSYATSGYESTLKWSEAKNEFKYEDYKATNTTKSVNIPSKKYITPIKVGIYKVNVETSENLKTTVTVKVAPSKFNANGVSSQGSTKDTVITWPSSTDGTNLYRLYMKKGKKYVKIYQGSKTVYRVKKLSANKTYSFKIAACYKASNGEILEGELSNVFKAVTAPKGAPKITYASLVSSKFTPQEKVWHAGYWVGLNWVPGKYVVNPAHTDMVFKLKFTSVKGASAYEYNGYASNYTKEGYSTVKSGQNLTYSKFGKITGTFGIKVRAIKKNKKFNSVAYGSWSTVKNVNVGTPK